MGGGRNGNFGNKRGSRYIKNPGNNTEKTQKKQENKTNAKKKGKNIIYNKNKHNKTEEKNN